MARSNKDFRKSHIYDRQLIGFYKYNDIFICNSRMVNDAKFKATNKQGLLIGYMVIWCHLDGDLQKITM